MKDKTVNTQSKSQALSNKELQFAIDNTVASLRTPPFGGQVSGDAKEMLLAHLHDLLLCQRARAGVQVNIEFDVKSIMESR